MNPLIEYFNEKLKSRGRTLDGRAIWRLVWSTDQKEIRKGKFSDYYGNIFLRENTEVRSVPKYWNSPDRWVLERLCFIAPNAAIHNEVLAQSDLDIFKPFLNGTYEPIYFFQDKNRNPLPVTEWALDAVMHELEFGQRIKVTDSEMQDDYLKETDREAEYFQAEIDNAGRSPLFAQENSVYIERKEPDVVLTAKK